VEETAVGGSWLSRRRSRRWSVEGVAWGERGGGGPREGEQERKVHPRKEGGKFGGAFPVVYAGVGVGLGRGRGSETTE